MAGWKEQVDIEGLRGFLGEYDPPVSHHSVGGAAIGDSKKGFRTLVYEDRRPCYAFLGRQFANPHCKYVWLAPFGVAETVKAEFFQEHLDWFCNESPFAPYVMQVDRNKGRGVIVCPESYGFDGRIGRATGQHYRHFWGGDNTADTAAYHRWYEEGLSMSLIHLFAPHVFVSNHKEGTVVVIPSQRNPNHSAIAPFLMSKAALEAYEAGLMLPTEGGTTSHSIYGVGDVYDTRGGKRLEACAPKGSVAVDLHGSRSLPVNEAAGKDFFEQLYSSLKETPL